MQTRLRLLCAAPRPPPTRRSNMTRPRRSQDDVLNGINVANCWNVPTLSPTREISGTRRRFVSIPRLRASSPRKERIPGNYTPV